MFDIFFGYDFYRKHREKLLMIIDLGIVIFSYLFSYWIKNDFSIEGFITLDIIELFKFAIVILSVYTVIFLLFRVHKSLWKYINTNEIINLSKANLIATVTIISETFLFGLSRSLLSLEIIAGILALLLMFSLRSLYRMYRSYTSQKVSANSKNAIIIGAGDGGNLLFKELIQNPKFEYNVIGFVDDIKQNVLISGKPILGTMAELHEIVNNHSIKVAMIAIPSATQEEKLEITEKCRREKLEVKMMNMSNVLDDSTFDTLTPVQDIQIEDLLGRGEVTLEQKEISSYIKNSVICVTGAGGSIGSELCRKILDFKPKKLIMIDVNENALYMLEQEFNRKREYNKISNQIEIISLIVSIRERNSILSVLKQYNVDVVYHAAAHKHVPLMERSPNEAVKNNIFGTYNVIYSSIEAKVKRLIMISTDKAVNPTNVMGATKRMTELILQSYGKDCKTKMAAVRFGNVLGSNGSVIPIFKEQIKNGGPVTVTDKRMTRFFMTIPEASQLVLQAGYYANQGEIFILEMGEAVKIMDLARKMIRLSGFVPDVDIEIREIGLRPGEKLFEELKLSNEKMVKTKNNLILKNSPVEITVDEIDSKLKKLENALKKEVSGVELKSLLMELIK